VSTTPLSCERALLILMADIADHSRDERIAARLHASRCPRCSSVYDPDEAVAPTIGRRPPESPASLRIGLAVVATIQLVLAVPWLFGHSLVPDAHVEVSHLTRDGALGLVIAGLGLVTAWRPRYVNSTTLIGLLVFAAQLVAGLVDHETDAVTGSFELIHLLVLVILASMFGIAFGRARRATPRAERVSRVLRAR
jgi:hypothetical protein